MGNINLDGVILSASMCRIRDWKNFTQLMRIGFPELTGKQLSDEVRTNGRHSCLFRYQGELVAYWMLNSSKGPKIAKPEQAAIQPTWRSRKLGKPLFNDFCQFAAWVGFEEIHSSVLKNNKVSLAISESLGFVTFPDKTEDRILLIKKVEPSMAHNWSPPSNIRSLRVKNKLLNPRVMSKMESFLTRMIYIILVSARR